MIKLLSTDFDGTLVGNDREESCVAPLALELETIKREGALWCINTGRPLTYLLHGLEHFAPPIRPDYLITQERYLFYDDPEKGWIPLGDWNALCDRKHQELFEASQLFFQKMKALVAQDPRLTLLQSSRGSPDCLASEDEQALHEMMLELLRMPERPDDFSFQPSTSYQEHFLSFHHRHYNKGTALEALRQFLSLHVEQIMAIGDHHNDLAMLDSSIAAMLACPSNAHPRVKEAILKGKGHIARSAYGEGTAEAISFFHGRR